MPSERLDSGSDTLPTRRQPSESPTEWLTPHPLIAEADQQSTAVPLQSQSAAPATRTTIDPDTDTDTNTAAGEQPNHLPPVSSATAEQAWELQQSSKSAPAVTPVDHSGSLTPTLRIQNTVAMRSHRQHPTEPRRKPLPNTPVAAPALPWLTQLRKSFLRCARPSFRWGDRCLGWWPKALPATTWQTADEAFLIDQLDGLVDGDNGLLVHRKDAPELYGLLEELQQRMRVTIPTEIRLFYLPVCGVQEFRESEPVPRLRLGQRLPPPRSQTSKTPSKQVLTLGLPCLQIWTVDELQAVLAHELAHLHLQDTIFLRDVLQFWLRVWKHTEEFGKRERRWNPRYRWQRWCAWLGMTFASQISRQMEFRADRWAAAAVGIKPLSSALAKMGIAQSIFDYTLNTYDPIRHAPDNIYENFIQLWKKIPKPEYQVMGKRTVRHQSSQRWDLHPSIKERLSRLLPKISITRKKRDLAIHLLHQREKWMAVMHNRLFGMWFLPSSDSVFFPHRK